MLKVNKKVEYALIALKYISDQNIEKVTSLVSAREICENFDTPFDTTAKVLQIMNNNGILDSIKGIKGGYTLKSNLKDVTYIQLEEMIEGKVINDFCSKQKGVCNLFESCNIVKPVANLNNKVNKMLKAITLHELLIEAE